MHNNFEVLQAKCRRYYLKKTLKIGLPIGVIVLFIIILLLSFSEEKKEIVKKTNIVKKEILQTEDDNIFEKPKEEVSIPKSKEKKLKIEDVEYHLNSYNYDFSNKKDDVVVQKKPIKNKIIPKVNHQSNKQTIKIQKKNNSFSIVLKNLDSVNKMIEVYNKEPTYSIALKIAKAFFLKQRYNDSLLWSKKANELDTRAEEAWLIYAKSEYALGHKNRAKGILKVYINNSDSKEAKSLLISWIKGKNK